MSSSYNVFVVLTVLTEKVMVMRIKVQTLQVFRILFKAIPLRTPNRTEIIQNHAKWLLQEENPKEDSDITVDIHSGGLNKDNVFSFRTKEHN